jgi:hypothetical protein
MPLKSNINNINILQWNVRSLPARLPSLQFLLADQKCSIAILSETWLIPSRSINIPHFRIFSSDRPVGYGGSAVVMHNSLQAKLISIDTVTKTNLINHKIDLLGVDILSSDSQSPLGLWSCYIPNSFNIPTHLFQNICSMISKNSLLCGVLIIFIPPGSPIRCPVAEIFCTILLISLVFVYLTTEVLHTSEDLTQPTPP